MQMGFLNISFIDTHKDIHVITCTQIISNAGTFDTHVLINSEFDLGKQ